MRALKKDKTKIRQRADQKRQKRDKEQRTKMDLLLSSHSRSNGAALRLVRPEDNARQDESKTRQEKIKARQQQDNDNDGGSSPVPLTRAPFCY
jgi:hypothetical protein